MTDDTSTAGLAALGMAAMLAAPAIYAFSNRARFVDETKRKIRTSATKKKTKTQRRRDAKKSQRQARKTTRRNMK